MKIRLYTTISTLCLLSIAGCATGRPVGGTSPGAGPQPGPPPLNAALVTTSFGWVLTRDTLLLTHDGGASFDSVPVPLPAGTVRDAYFADESTGLVAAADRTAIAVARTTDGGRTWQIDTIADASASPTGYSQLTVSFGDESFGAILARTATSAAFSVGTLLSTVDGGASWSARPAPEAGQLAVEPGGRTWVAGGNLNLTDDRGANWARAQLKVDGLTGTVTPSTPVDGQLPVTVVDGDKTSVKLLTTPDHGRTWSDPKQVAVQGKAGPGVRMPVARTRSGVVVFDSVAGHAIRALDGADLRPSGLPAGVTDVGFVPGGEAGWAQAAYGTCGNGKLDCVLHHELMGTADAGAHWHLVASWIEQVG